MNVEDFHTVCWKHVVAHIGQRIEEMRQDNDTQHTEIDTARIRGGICELKKILALAEQASAGHATAPELISDGQVLSGQWLT